MEKIVDDIPIDQGADFIEELQICDEDLTPIDITGYAFSGQIRRFASDDEKKADFVCTIVDPTHGKVRFTLLGADSSLFVLDKSTQACRTITRWTYDYEMVDTSLVPYRLKEGVALISPEVTHS